MDGEIEEEWGEPKHSRRFEESQGLRWTGAREHRRREETEIGVCVCIYIYLFENALRRVRGEEERERKEGRKEE